MLEEGQTRGPMGHATEARNSPTRIRPTCFCKGPEAIKWGNDHLFNKRGWSHWPSVGWTNKQTDLDLNVTSYRKTNREWTVDLNVKSKTITFRKRNIGEDIWAREPGSEFVDWIPKAWFTKEKLINWTSAKWKPFTLQMPIGKECRDKWQTRWKYVQTASPQRTTIEKL